MPKRSDSTLIEDGLGSIPVGNLPPNLVRDLLGTLRGQTFIPSSEKGKIEIHLFPSCVSLDLPVFTPLHYARRKTLHPNLIRIFPSAPV